MACSSWQPAVLPFAVALIEKFGAVAAVRFRKNGSAPAYTHLKCQPSVVEAALHSLSFFYERITRSMSFIARFFSKPLKTAVRRMT